MSGLGAPVKPLLATTDHRPCLKLAGSPVLRKPELGLTLSRKLGEEGQTPGRFEGPDSQCIHPPRCIGLVPPTRFGTHSVLDNGIARAGFMLAKRVARANGMHCLAALLDVCVRGPAPVEGEAVPTAGWDSTSGSRWLRS